MTKRRVVIVSAVRTAIGRFQGALSAMPAPLLGGVAIREAVRRCGIDPVRVDEVLMGNVVQAGIGQAPARQAAIKAGLPPSVGATTVNKICGSGMKAAMLGAQAIKAEEADIIVAGGMENMTLGPYLLPQARQGYRLGNGTLVDAMILDGLWCAFENHHMGNSAEWIAREYGLTRQELDQFAVDSQAKAIAAIQAGRFKAEITPVEVPQRKGPPVIFDTDECPRADTTLEALSKLSPAFQKDGMVTAGNSPGITDGAAALVLMGEDTAVALGVKPLAVITGYDQAAVEPLRIFTAPIFAVKRVLSRAGYRLEDIDLIEINEAFAAQTLADGKALGVDWNKVNVNGGAIALGHPIGCSGARVLVTLLYALRDRGLRTGLATLCLGGGEAVAMTLELL
ncbi:MAG TPA: acetyl-CoA C-acetyltransferase [Anaerolineae bacterium]|nr:acetyl-CoA C-acetyltransferase [Anaerolineae bacterium]HQJ52440.1 acetyl-CoA C-acetyltransferase [Anaerolineae bacterium]